MIEMFSFFLIVIIIFSYTLFYQGKYDKIKTANRTCAQHFAELVTGQFSAYATNPSPIIDCPSLDGRTEVLTRNTYLKTKNTHFGVFFLLELVTGDSPVRGNVARTIEDNLQRQKGCRLTLVDAAVPHFLFRVSVILTFLLNLLYK